MTCAHISTNNYGVSELSQFWIFVLTEYNDYWRVSLDNILERIKTTKSYPLGHKTPNRTRIAQGDKVVFYQSGEEGRRFIGSAVVDSVAKNSDQFILGHVHFSKIRIWKQSIDVYDVLNELSFIKNKRRWQCYFQGGIRKIPRNDYEKILNRRH